MISKGKHKGRAISGEYGESKHKGTTFVRVEFQIVGGDSDGEYVTWDGYFTDKTTERTVESLKACGCAFAGNDITDLGGLEMNEVNLVVEHEEWQDEKTGEPKTRARVAWVNSGTGRGIAPEQKMDSGKRAAFKARMAGALVAVNAKAEAAGAAPRKPAPARKPDATQWDGTGGDPDNSDLPF